MHAFASGNLPDTRPVDHASRVRLRWEIALVLLLSVGRSAIYAVLGLIQALQRENAIAASGDVDTGSQRVYVRLDLGLDTAAAVRAIPVESGGRLLTVGDVAEVKRGYVEPRRYTLRYKGRDAIGLGIVMAKGGNVLKLGEQLDAAMEKVRAELPVAHNISIYGRVDNLFDEKYETVAGYGTYGRAAYGGVRLRFE